MLRDFLGDCLRGQTRWPSGRSEDEAGASANQRREDDVRVSDDGGRQ